MNAAGCVLSSAYTSSATGRQCIAEEAAPILNSTRAPVRFAAWAGVICTPSNRSPTSVFMPSVALHRLTASSGCATTPVATFSSEAMPSACTENSMSGGGRGGESGGAGGEATLSSSAGVTPNPGTVEYDSTSRTPSPSTNERSKTIALPAIQPGCDSTSAIGALRSGVRSSESVGSGSGVQVTFARVRLRRDTSKVLGPWQLENGAAFVLSSACTSTVTGSQCLSLE